MKNWTIQRCSYRLNTLKDKIRSGSAQVAVDSRYDTATAGQLNVRHTFHAQH